VDVAKMRVGNSYVLVNPTIDVDKGYTTEPFTVRKRTVDSAGGIFFAVDQNSYDEVNIIVKNSGIIGRLGRDALVPKHYKAVKLNADTLRVLGRPAIIEQWKENNDYMKTASLSLFKNGAFVQRYDDNAGLEYSLVTDYGLSVEDAEHYADTGNTFWVKKANPMGPVGRNSSIGAGIFAGTAPGGIQEPEYTLQPARARHEPTELLNSYERVKNEIDKAVSLSDNGMKDVFDSSLLGVMSKISDVDSELQSYIPDMMKGMDKLARILFIFWYRPEKIKDKYSLNEFSESEDLLKDTFKNIGEVVLDLKQKFGIEDG